MDGGLAQALDNLLSVDPAALEKTELHDTVVGLQRLDSLYAAARARFADTWDAKKLWASDGSKAAGARLARDACCDVETARAEVRRARKLRTMPLTRKAYEHGDLSTDHVDVIARANREPITEQFADGETTLVDAARNHDDFEDFRRAVQQWAHAADDNATDDQAEKAHRDRWFRDAETYEGTHDLQGRLDPIGGAIFAAELAAIEQRFFDDDWAAARAEHGEAATRDQLARSTEQRRADALVEMARRSGATTPGARPTRPLFSVLVDYPTLAGRICQLANGTPIAPAELVPWLTEADIERVVWSGRSRVIDIGTRTRLFTGATRRAIELRDRHCTHPGCTVAAEWCQVDHIIEYSDGGETTQANGRLLCGFHNRQRPGRTSQPPEGP